MTKPGRLAIAVMALVFFVTGVGILVPHRVAAVSAQCTDGPLFAFGREKWCGYFYNNYYTSGEEVRIGGIPSTVDTAEAFINLIVSDLHSASAHRKTGAQFVILTMLGRGAGLPKSVTETGTGTSNQLETWKASVRSYANFSENGTTQSTGENGRIDWHVWEHLPCGTINTYYQVAQNDIAPFANNTGNSNCGDSTSKEEFLLFRDKSGAVIYRIRRACMNPMGVLKALAKPQPDKYDLTPSISTTVGGSPVTGGVEAGQTIRFTYGVRNSGTDPSPSANCTIYSNVHIGYFDTRSDPPPGGGAGPATGCPRVFNAGSFVTLATEDVPTSDNQTVCRSLLVNPATSTIASRGVEACVPVVNKPYFKVYGGDISAGNGAETSPDTCVNNIDAAIIGWNRGPAGGYGGAGTQFAAFALNKIFESTTAVGNSGPNLAPAPSGLAFAGAASGSVYGGMFGSLPCTTDYYAALPVSPMPFAALPAVSASGAYKWNSASQLNLSGPVAAGKRITLYVDGDVFINGDITYPASWTSGNAPLFELVARGNIYIKNNVSRLDGIFIAQKNGATGGTIYTCTLSGSPLVADSTLYSKCKTKLTINGVFVANDVQFLRTAGTRYRGTGTEPNTSNNIAEVFNFSPALWMAQPVGSKTGPSSYDSITSLPPVL